MNNLKSSWELIAHEIESIETSNTEILKDQILYSCNRQLRELEAINKKTASMIQELEHVQNWVRGM